MTMKAARRSFCRAEFCAETDINVLECCGKQYNFNAFVQ
jgi:hypothetical protein